MAPLEQWLWLLKLKSPQDQWEAELEPQALVCQVGVWEEQPGLPGVGQRAGCSSPGGQGHGAGEGEVG